MILFTSRMTAASSSHCIVRPPNTVGVRCPVTDEQNKHKICYNMQGVVDSFDMTNDLTADLSTKTANQKQFSNNLIESKLK